MYILFTLRTMFKCPFGFRLLFVNNLLRVWYIISIFSLSLILLACCLLGAEISVDLWYLWGPIDPMGTIHMGKSWAYGLIPNPRIRAYPRTISKGRNENCIIGRGKEYLWRT